MTDAPITNPPPSLDMGEAQPSTKPIRFAAYMRRMAQIAAQPGCHQIILLVDKDGVKQWSMTMIGKMEGV